MADNSENVKKTDEFLATLSYVVGTYTLSRDRPSSSAGSGRFLSKLRTFHREQLKAMIDDFFDSEENGQSTLPSSTTVPSVNVASNQEVTSAQVVTTSASQSIPSDQLVNSGEGKDEPIGDDSSTRSREDNANTAENIVNVPTGEHQSALADAVMIVASTSARANSSTVHNDNSNEQSGGEGDSSAGQPAAANNQLALVPYTGPPAQGIFGDAAANQLVPLELQVEEAYYYDDDMESIKSEIYSDEELPMSEEEMDPEPDDDEEYNFSNISVKSEDVSDVENEQEDLIIIIDDPHMLAIEGIPNTDDNGSQEENTGNELVGNSADNSNIEERDDSQAVELIDEAIEEQQSDAETTNNEEFAHEASNSEPVQSGPPDDSFSGPSTSTGRRRSSRLEKKLSNGNTTIDHSSSRKRVNSIRKNKSVAVESESSESSDDEEFVGQQNSTKRKVSASGAAAKKAKHSHTVQQSAVVASGRASVRQEPLKVITKRLNCPQDDCNTVCIDKTSLNVHLLEQHAIEQYRCIVADCTASFEHQIQMTDHLDGHGNPSDWPCGKCSSSFDDYSELQSHHYYQHEEGLFECSVNDCDYKWTNRRKVYNHQDCHRTPKHICSVGNCGRSFAFKANLDQHLRSHTQERPFACDQCDRAFTRKEHLIVHLRWHSGTMKARCTWNGCTYQATTSSAVMKHVRRVHFKLPQSKSKQLELGIIDDRDARPYLEKI